MTSPTKSVVTTWWSLLVLALLHSYFLLESGVTALPSSDTARRHDEESGDRLRVAELGVTVATFPPSLVPAAVRPKRSRDEQQLCGYRLLDALRNVCDRNFIGFSRRSDPSTLVLQGSSNGGDGVDGQSGEEGCFAGGLWRSGACEVIPFDYPPPPSFDHAVMMMGGGLNGMSSSSGQGDLTNNLSVLDGDGGSDWGTRTSTSSVWPKSNKAFTLKMLGEGPKTHHRFRRNIIDECCRKPCAMRQMLKYCAITSVGKRMTF